MQFTEEQNLAIHTDNCNLLVAAGAGSGKTAVLVERIINKVVNNGIDIDRMLVVTFTNAAASEMRERLASRLYKESLKNNKLQKQLMLLSKASISTIDSFCLKVVKDYFYKLDLDPNFRIIEESEAELLKEETLEELLEMNYEEESEELMNIIYQYSSNKDDETIKNLILKIYNFTRSIVNPKEWINQKIEYYNIDNSNFEDNPFIKVIIDYSKKQISNSINELKLLLDDIGDSELAGKYVDVLYDDMKNLKYLLDCSNTWDKFSLAIQNFEFATARGTKNVPEDLKNQINEVRDSIKKTIYKEIRDKIFVYNSDEIKSDFDNVYKTLKSFERLVDDFSKLYYEKKLEKNIFDFNDIEHFALDILTNDVNVSSFYKEKFDEIMIDEYQDSNMIQEIILNSFSRNNVFMVGDVKQSIYKFRQARPELFLEKYEKFDLVNSDFDSDISVGKKVLLFKNFRSNSNVVDQVNYIFEKIMSKDIGDIDYSYDEFLKCGADYYHSSNEKAELVLIETGNIDDTLEEYDDIILDSKASLEGRYIANKIKSMVGNIEIYDKKTSSYRKAEYRDFAILLRNTVGRVEYISEELSNLNIPSYADNAGEYFSNIEVQTILSALKIIDNPIQDIPLVDVLKSQIGNFTIDELSCIRLVNKTVSFYEAMLEAKNLNNELAIKVSAFIEKLERWREKSRHVSIWELIWQIFNETGFYYYVSLFPDGVKRQANLNLLLERAEKYENTSFKGLFNFLNYIDNIKSVPSDFSESKMVGENDNVVRIMSVHKSKGLEFPIVFLAGTDKPFNRREKQDNIILDHDIGFGMDIIDYETRIKYPCISKYAIEIKNKKDSLSEEMRILYVALTRAREKLFVTGLVKDLDKAITKYSGVLTKFKLNNAHSLLDWIGYSVCGKTSIWNIEKVSANSLISNNIEEEETSNNNNYSVNSELFKKIDEQMNWNYAYIDSTALPNKISITEIKRRLSNDSSENLENMYNDVSLKDLPDFVENNHISGASYGTLIHNILQKIDFKCFSEDVLDKELEQIKADTYSKNSIKNKLLAFSKTKIFNEIVEAKIVEKEKAFNLNILAKELYDVNSNDSIMVQGIIDLFFISKDNKIFLLDYKTDNVQDENELINRYSIQLKLYKRALEEILDRKVDKTIIYSFNLEKEIELFN